MKTIHRMYTHTALTYEAEKEDVARNELSVYLERSTLLCAYIHIHMCVWTEVETKKSDVQLPVRFNQVLERTEYKWLQRPFGESHLTREHGLSNITSLLVSFFISTFTLICRHVNFKSTASSIVTHHHTL